MIAIEAKRALDPRPGKGFCSAVADLPLVRGFVAYPGEESYPLGEHAWGLPAGQIGRLAGGDIRSLGGVELPA